LTFARLRSRRWQPKIDLRGVDDVPTRTLSDTVLGSEAGGKLLAWLMAQSGHRSAVVERKLIGGSCPSTNCLSQQDRDLERKGRRSGTFAGIWAALSDSVRIGSDPSQPIHSSSKRNEMRSNALCLIGCLAASAIPLSAGAQPVQSAVAARAAQSEREGIASALRDPPSAHNCPSGYYWEPASYAKHGKFRLAHCARRW